MKPGTLLVYADEQVSPEEKRARLAQYLVADVAATPAAIVAPSKEAGTVADPAAAAAAAAAASAVTTGAASPVAAAKKRARAEDLME